MSEKLEDIKRSRDYQRERVRHVKIARNRNADGLAYWRDRAMKYESALDRIIGIDTTVSDGGKVHDHGRCAEIAIDALKESTPSRKELGE